MKKGEGQSRGEANQVLPVQDVCGRIRHKKRIGQAHNGQAHLRLW